jgi:hypothetical protein
VGNDEECNYCDEQTIVMLNDEVICLTCGANEAELSISGDEEVERWAYETLDEIFSSAAPILTLC